MPKYRVKVQAEIFVSSADEDSARDHVADMFRNHLEHMRDSAAVLRTTFFVDTITPYERQVPNEKP